MNSGKRRGLSILGFGLKRIATAAACIFGIPTRERGRMLVTVDWCFSLADASGFLDRKNAAARLRAQRRLGEPKLKKSVRCAPFLGAVAFL